MRQIKMNTSKLHKQAVQALTDIKGCNFSPPILEAESVQVLVELAQGVLDLMGVNKKLAAKKVELLGQLYIRDEQLKELRSQTTFAQVSLCEGAGE